MSLTYAWKPKPWESIERKKKKLQGEGLEENQKEEEPTWTSKKTERREKRKGRGLVSFSPREESVLNSKNGQLH